MVSTPDPAAIDCDAALLHPPPPHTHTHTHYNRWVSMGLDLKVHERQTASESRRDQEEGREPDSHKEASPEEIKSRKVVLG